MAPVAASHGPNEEGTMKSSIVYHWRHAYPGREITSLDLKKETDELMTKFMGQGIVTEYAWHLSASGDMNFLVVCGEMDKLQMLTTDPDVMFLTTRVGMVNDGFEWSFCATGPTVDAMTDLYAAAAATMPA
jgi:hypothetical protein